MVKEEKVTLDAVGMIGELRCGYNCTMLHNKYEFYIFIIRPFGCCPGHGQPWV